jgi:hypothetical protein
MLKDRTVLLHDGTQIIYLGRSNKTFLWHPSNAQVIPGWWTTRATGEYPRADRPSQTLTNVEPEFSPAPRIKAAIGLGSSR